MPAYKLNWQAQDGFRFGLSDGRGAALPVADWNTKAPQFQPQQQVLQSLTDNGFADYSHDCCVVSFDGIYALTEIDQQILEFPAPYPYEILVQASGTLNQPSFKFKYGFYEFVPHGKRFVASRNGPVLSFEGRTYLLSFNQFKVCEALDAFNALPEQQKSFSKNLVQFADIKYLSREAAVLLDGYLENENVIHPDKITVDIHFHDGTLEILPNPGAEDQRAFVKSFDTYPVAQSTYTITNTAGCRTRIALDETQQEALQVLKCECRRVTDTEKVREIIDTPFKILDGDIFDLTAFYSERVISIGVYKPKFYPFVCPYKSEWIPGIQVEDRVNGTKRVFFTNEADLQTFKEAARKAELEGGSSVTWEGVDIPIADAAWHTGIAERQLKKRTKPDVEGNRQSEETKVLIIEENAERLGYCVGIESLPEMLDHRLGSIENLAAGIELRTHQVEGVAWLQSVFNTGLRGCLLADDMGLGKTLQLLYFIEWHSQHLNTGKPYLIVAPIALLENWEREYTRFFPDATVPVCHLNEDVELGVSYSPAVIELLQKKQMILTNYETVRRCQLNICAVDFAVVVLDEAQKIKTPGTLVTNAAKALKADFKVAMTGTPVENGLVDLWCIMDFAKPGLLGNAKDFASKYQNPLRNTSEIIPLAEELKNRIGCLIKRRLKKDVISDLPKKEEEQIRVKMPPRQLQRYKIEVAQAKEDAELGGSEGRNSVLRSLHALRDISDHPYLAESRITDYSSQELVETSAKLKATVDLLHRIRAKNEKAILFADRKETQKMLQKVVFDVFNLLPRIINGDTPSSQTGRNRSSLSRQQTIDDFEAVEGFNAIVMSPLAAGVGLNVTGANHVIHYSRHWNPAKEQQASDRAYRIGQTKDVFIYYPMAVADEFRSFDEVLNELLDRKKGLASTFLFPTDQAEVTPAELFKDVFNVRANGEDEPFTFARISKLNPGSFEAFAAALFGKQGYKATLTPLSNDKGADVVILSDRENLLIQVKQSTKPLDLSAVQEVLGAKGYYEKMYGINLKPAVFTNSSLNQNASEYAAANHVIEFNREIVRNWLSAYPVTIGDVIRAEKNRLMRI